MQMKKIFTLLMLAGALVFSACEESGENPAWKQLPTTPITGADATLTVNGDTNSGSVQLTASSATQGTLTMTGVLPGYSEVSMDVTLSEKADGSFDISGEKGLTTSPAMRSAAAEPVIFNLAVRGNITPEGKITVSVTSALSTEAQGGLTGNWALQYESAITEEGTLATAPLWMDWSALDPDKPNAEFLATMASTFGSAFLFQYLNQVTFSADGNITAKYWTGSLEIGEVLGSMDYNEDQTSALWSDLHNNEWLSSPKNLAFWYVKDGCIRVVPNINAILGQVGEDNDGAMPDMSALTEIIAALSEYGIDIAPLLPTILEWLDTGIPLKYAVTDGALKVYIDKEMAAPFVTALLPALPKIDEMIAQMKEQNPDDETVQMIDMLLMMLRIENFAGFETIWKENTKDFGIALNFMQPKKAE